MSKHVLRVLGVSLLAALGLTAFTVAGAQAANLAIGTHVHGKWFVLGSNALPASVTGEAEGAGRVLVPSLGVEINCPTFTITSASISNTVSNGHGVVSLIFHECKVFSIEKVLPFNLTSPTALPCLPLDSVTGADGDIRAEALILLVLHENKDYIIFEQVNLEATKPLKVIKYSPETGCPIPLKQEVFGSYALEVNTGDKHTGAEVLEPLITAGSHKKLQELFGLTLKYGTNEAFIDGSAKLQLTGAHKGCTWGGL